MTALPSLDGRKFAVAEMDVQGEAGSDTVFEYQEEDGVISARYTGGGAVRHGFLVGRRDSARLEFRYSQLNTSGETSSRPNSCMSKL